MGKIYRARAVESLIRGYLLKLRRNWRKSQLNWPDGLAYYWNEREFQWALLQHMKDHAGAQGLGSDKWVRAEAVIDPARWDRRAGFARPDLAVVDPTKYRRYLDSLKEEDEGEFPTYESIIELKVVWTKTGPAAHRESFTHDIRKLQRALRDDVTHSAYFVVLDNRDKHGVPYFSPDELYDMKKGTGVRIFHWPDGWEARSSPSEYPIKLY